MVIGTCISSMRPSKTPVNSVGVACSICNAAHDEFAARHTLGRKMPSASQSYGSAASEHSRCASSEPLLTVSELKSACFYR
eukprot:scaffold15308_cov65-Phaeocystis_antarctica.AAC.2